MHSQYVAPHSTASVCKKWWADSITCILSGLNIVVSTVIMDKWMDG